MKDGFPNTAEAQIKGEKHVFTVTELTRLIRQILDEAFPAVWVEGEISNFTRSSAGHMYFSLKDENAVLQCALFSNTARGIRFLPEDGMKVICSGRVSFYEKSGRCQLYIDMIEPKGKGDLYAAFEQLKEKLRKEGLFDEARKKEIPYLPRRIGVVTSPTGAAIRDILNVVRRRFQNVEVILNPVRVQGEGAAGEIAGAIREFNLYNRTAGQDGAVNVLIVGRGGGSIEDLWAFNEEVVARAIYASDIPVISAVGHEVDYTIADFVADLRAPTPSAAAELVIPRKEDLKAQIDELERRLDGLTIDNIQGLWREVERLLESRVLRQPMNIVETYQQRVDELTRALGIHIGHFLEMDTEVMNGLSGKLEMLSPFNVLSRGYSITTDAETGKVLKDAGKVKTGDAVKTRLEKGEFSSVVRERT